jgi:hypothetical protein
MKISRLFNLLQDVQDLLSMFENVSGTAQMVSCLERMRRGQAPEDFYNTIQSLRVSLTEAFNDQLELGGDLSNPEDETADSITDSLLEETWEEKEEEETTSDVPTPPVTPST